MLIKCVITESLNTEMVKAENPDAVVATEPQGKTRIEATLKVGRSNSQIRLNAEENPINQCLMGPFN